MSETRLPEIDFCPECGQEITWICLACGEPEKQCRCRPGPDVLWGAGTGCVFVPFGPDERLFPLCKCTEKEFQELTGGAACA